MLASDVCHKMHTFVCRRARCALIGWHRYTLAACELRLAESHIVCARRVAVASAWRRHLSCLLTSAWYGWADRTAAAARTRRSMARLCQGTLARSLRSWAEAVRAAELAAAAVKRVHSGRLRLRVLAAWQRCALLAVILHFMCLSQSVGHAFE